MGDSDACLLFNAELNTLSKAQRIDVLKGEQKPSPPLPFLLMAQFKSHLQGSF